MNEELTNEVLEAMKKCSFNCALCDANGVCDKYNWQDTIQTLATALLEERAKPKVWDGAPKDASVAEVYFGNKQVVSATPDHTYNRELPNTRARKYAEEIEKALSTSPRYKTEVEIIESALNKYAEEFKGEA